MSFVARGEAILATIRALLRPYGVELAPDLRVVADTHPCPGYLHEERTIAFCPPEVATRVDHLRWTFYLRYMGCESLEEARAFYDVALPFVIAHEAAHHVRITRGLDGGGAFVEEQVCDRVAAAVLDALEEHRGSLVELQRKCATMRARLAERFADLPTTAFVPDVAELAVGEEGRARVAALRRASAREGLDYEALLALLPEASQLEEAKARRSRARGHLDLHYTRDPAEYWYASVVWLERYLASDERPGLIEVVNLHLLSGTRSDAEEMLALVDGLDSLDPVIAEASATALLETMGAGVVHDLVDRALERRATDAILRALVRGYRSSFDRAAIARLAAAPWSDPLHLQLVLRLAGLAGVPLSVARTDGLPIALECEIRAMNDDVGDALLDPDRTGPMLDALVAHRRTLDGIDARLLPRRGSNRWDQLLAVARTATVDERAPAIVALRAAAFEADRRGVPLDPRACDRALRLASAARALRRGDGFAADALDLLARRLAIEIALANVPARARSAAAQIATLIDRPGPIDPALADVLAAHAPDEAVRARVRAMLAGDIDVMPWSHGQEARRDLLAALPEVVACAIARLVPDAFDGYAASEDVATLLDKVIRLRSVPLFTGLGPEQLTELGTLAIERRHRAGDVIVREGDRGDELHVVLEGEISIERGGVVLATLAAPSCFGEMALFDGSPRSADAIARTDCRLLSLEGDGVRRAGRRDPAMYEALLRVLSQRLRDAIAQVRGRDR